MKLVIVESPGKIKKIQSYLGKDFQVEASFGHIRDLNPKGLSVDIENDFKPSYVISTDKKKVVSKLKKLSSKASETILAADQDREGEAIAFSLKDELKLKDPPRMIFTEITKTALERAVSNPSKINMNEVFAQQGRRILDRIVGYQLSPLLWKYLPGTKSAGRVQSVLVRILVEKERLIRETQSDLRVKLYGEFNYDNKKINSTLYKKEKIMEFENLDQTKKLLNYLSKEDEFMVEQIIKTNNKKNPPPPFITSTLQQEASIRLKFPTKKTMSVAQKLYEKGLITYMRTDSTMLSKTAMGMMKTYILEKFGKEYYQGKNYTTNKKNAQEAHEAIRPTKLDVNFSKLTNEESKLLLLIINRALASQMKPAIITNQKIIIKCNNTKWNKYYFQTMLNKIKFDGYLKIYNNQEDNNKLVKLNENDILIITSLTATEDFKEPPKRLNEAMLVKYLEKKSIGRPSTYSSLISKIIDRKYVETRNITGEKKKINYLVLNNKLDLQEKTKDIFLGSEKMKLVPTEIGFQTNDFLMKYFSNILEENFTAHLEEQLDLISKGKITVVSLLSDFYQNLKPIIKSLNDQVVVKKDDIDELLGEINNCKIYFGESKYGKYVKKYENNKWKFSSVESKPTLKEAEKLLVFPKLLGKKGKTEIYLNNGKYGPYIKFGKTNTPVPKDIDINQISQEDAFDYILGKNDKYTLHGFFNKNNLILIKKGQYGKYIQTNIKGKKTNIPLRTKNIPDNETIIKLINNKKN